MLKKRKIIDESTGSNTSKGTQRCTVLLDTRTNSRRRLQYQERTELRKYWKEANQCFSIAMLFILQDWYSTKTMDPTLHYKMKADEAYDGSGDGAADPIRMKNSDVQSETRAQKQQQNHRNGNRHTCQW